MRNRRLINQIVAVGGATCLALTILVSPIATVSVQAAAPSTDGIQQDIIEWRYKVQNGCVYRRLYNYTINDWVGEWEYVCPYPTFT